MGSSNEPNGLQVKAFGGAHFLVLRGPLRLDDPQSVRISDSTERKNLNGASACPCKAGIYGKLCMVVPVV